MEGGGVRQSRTSSRYAPSGPSPAAFNGPVRKWKKQWVTTAAAPPLLLCRWTPISPAADQPSARRFRYTPLVPIERGNKKAQEKVTSNEGGTQSNNNGGDSMLGKPTTGDVVIQAEEVSEDEEDSNKREDSGNSGSEKRRKLSPGRPKC